MEFPLNARLEVIIIIIIIIFIYVNWTSEGKYISAMYMYI